MEPELTNIVYIATSLDGYIADRDGGLDWLSVVPNPTGDDLGFARFMWRVDAVVMGRVTFQTVAGFGGGWPYPVPGIILSTTMTTAPQGFANHVQFASGSPAEIVAAARQQGYRTLYIDGGQTIQRFLQADLIDELILTEIPVLLGGGDRLFGQLDHQIGFELLETQTLLDQMVQRH